MNMVFNHGIHRIHGMTVSLVLLFGAAVSAVAAEPGITVEARQRYPWNGLVDLKFTITGEIGTKYDTSFTAKDMVGGTNIAMKTIRKSDGVAAAVEQLLPGSYNWVWDAPADLQVDTATYNAFISDSSTVLITNRSLSATANFYAVFGGGSISQNIGFTEAHAYNVKTDGNGKSIQFQVLNGGYLKCVCVHLEQSGSDIVGHIKWARYMSPTFPLGTDFDTAEYTEYDISTSDSVGGYGIKQLVLTYPNTSREPKFDRLTVTGMADISAFPYTVKFNANGGTGSMANQSFTYGTAKALTANAFTRTGYVFQGWATSASGGKVYNDKQSVKDLTTTSGAAVNLYAVWKAALYMVIDLSSGANYNKYPVSYLDAVPSGGWSDEYKMTKLVLRRIEAGTFTMGSPLGENGRTSNETQHSVTLTKPYYLGVFELTAKQYQLVMGSLTYRPYPDQSGYAWIGFNHGTDTTGWEKYPMEDLKFYKIRGKAKGLEISISTSVDGDSLIGLLRTRTGITTIDLPTEAQWEYACRAGTTKALYTNVDIPHSDYATDSTLTGIAVYYTSAGTSPVGTKKPNNWGLYDMYGNVWEWCLDWYTASLTNATDPLISNSSGNKVCRGGSYGSPKISCRSACRMSVGKDAYRAPAESINRGTAGSLGMRLCVTLSE